LSSLIVGFHPVRELLRHRPQSVRSVMISETRSGKRRQEIEALCAERAVRVDTVPRARFVELGVDVHNGFAAEAVGAVTRAGAEGGADPELVVLLEDIQDPRNLGAILRVCEGAGVSKVLVRDRGSAPLSAVAVRASAGAAEWVELERITNTARALDQLRTGGFWIHGAAEGGAPAWELDLTGKVVVCFGGEEKGLRERTRTLCDHLVGVPMRGRVDSLNVATAAAAILYEAVRQRMA